MNYFLDEIVEALYNARINEKHKIDNNETLSLRDFIIDGKTFTVINEITNDIVKREARLIDETISLIEKYKKSGVTVFDERLKFILSINK